MARKDNKETAKARQVPFNLMDLEPSATDDDTTVAGHLMLRQHRQLLYHMRLIEHEVPKLVGESMETHTTKGLQWFRLRTVRFSFQEIFCPSYIRNATLVRSISYGGEEHPVTVKRVIVATCLTPPS
jgi:small subunit ribosomal protein S35